MSFGGIHLRRRGARREDLQDAELEVPVVPSISGGQLPQRDIAAMSVPGIPAPAPKEAFGAVGCAHVQFARESVGNDVDAPWTDLRGICHCL